MGCCIRHEDGERTSISVWCSHAQAPACEIKSEHVTDGQQCWHPPGGKKAKNRSLGYFCPLTTGVLISVGPCLAHRRHLRMRCPALVFQTHDMTTARRGPSRPVLRRIFPTHFEERQTICEGYVHSCSIM